MAYLRHQQQKAFLVTLISTSNNLPKIPTALFELHTLKFLNLSFNNIESIHPSIVHLTSLSSLSLQRNILTKIPKELLQFSKLTYLGTVITKLSEAREPCALYKGSTTPVRVQNPNWELIGFFRRKWKSINPDNQTKNLRSLGESHKNFGFFISQHRCAPD